MRGLKAALRFGVVWLGLTGLGCPAAAEPGWKLLDFGPFALYAPATMLLTRGGADSIAGTLVDDGLRIDYDFGLYADPLQTRENAHDFVVRDGTVDGLPARFVSYGMGGKQGPTRFCEGVHVPEISRSALGWIRLTMLACGEHADKLRLARVIFSTLRVQRGNPD